MTHYSRAACAFALLAASGISIGSPARGAVVGLAHEITTCPAAAENGLWTVDLFVEFNSPTDQMLNVFNAVVSSSTGAFVDDPAIGVTPVGWHFFETLKPLAAVLDHAQNQCSYCADTYITIGSPPDPMLALAFDPNWGASPANMPAALNGQGWFLPGPASWPFGLAGNYPAGATYKVPIGRFTMLHAPNAKLNVTNISFALAGAGTTSLGPITINAPAAPAAMACPSAGPLRSRLFLLSGAPNGDGWSWCLNHPLMAADLCDYCVPGIGTPVYNDSRDITVAMAASINAGAAALCPTPATSLVATAPLLMIPTGAIIGVGCPPVPSNTYPLLVQLSDSVGSAAAPAWTLSVGPPCGPMNCIASGCTNACVINPSVTEVELTGLDCNGNGQDDIIDIVLGTSADANLDGIPDECAIPAACAARAGSCFVAHAGVGCSDIACCVSICAIDPSCCDRSWDAMCALFADALCVPSLPGDLDGDGAVNGADMGLLLAAWGTSNAAADLNHDGTVDGADFGSLLGYWTG